MGNCSNHSFTHSQVTKLVQMCHELDCMFLLLVACVYRCVRNSLVCFDSVCLCLQMGRDFCCTFLLLVVCVFTQIAHDMQVPEVSFWKSERCRDNEPVADAGCEGES